MPSDPELDFQNWMPVQSILQQKPVTIASAAVIAPVGFFTILTGNVAITTITPVLKGIHMIAIQFAGIAGVSSVGGNIQTTKASVNGEIMLLIYNPNTGKYVPVG